MQEAIIMSLKLMLSGILGGVVGYEREVHEHPAGLRTHILVCLGSTLITLISVSFVPPDGDPSRIAAQIVSGIGFLGAGTILRQGSIVRGLTTAASLWAVAGIGMAIGIGGTVYIWLATFATAIIFVTLSTLRHFEPSPSKRALHDLYIVMPEDRLEAFGEVLESLSEMGTSVQTIKSEGSPEKGKRAFRLKVVLSRKAKQETLVAKLTGQRDLDHFEWT